MLEAMKSKHATRDSLLAKEGLATLLALALLALAASLYPLEPVGSEAQTGGAGGAGQAAAPWLFLGLQELLRHLPAVIAGLAIPLAALLLYAALPWLGKEPASLTPRWRRAWHWGEYPAWLTLLAWIVLTLYAAMAY